MRWGGADGAGHTTREIRSPLPNLGRIRAPADWAGHDRPVAGDGTPAASYALGQQAIDLTRPPIHVAPVAQGALVDPAASRAIRAIGLLVSLAMPSVSFRNSRRLAAFHRQSLPLHAMRGGPHRQSGPKSSGAVVPAGSASSHAARPIAVGSPSLRKLHAARAMSWITRLMPSLFSSQRPVSIEEHLRSGHGRR